MTRNRFFHTPHPSEPATLAGTISDLAGALVIVACIVVAAVWLPEMM